MQHLPRRDFLGPWQSGAHSPSGDDPLGAAICVCEHVYGYILRLGAVWATSAARGRIDSMESHPAELLRDALALPLEARTALIDSLIESLDATVDEGATEAWKREIELRLKQIDDGTVELISWSAARKRLRDQLEP